MVPFSRRRKSQNGFRPRTSQNGFRLRTSQNGFRLRTSQNGFRLRTSNVLGPTTPSPELSAPKTASSIWSLESTLSCPSKKRPARDRIRAPQPAGKTVWTTWWWTHRSPRHQWRHRIEIRPGTRPKQTCRRGGEVRARAPCGRASWGSPAPCGPFSSGSPPGSELGWNPPSGKPCQPRSANREPDCEDFPWRPSSGNRSPWQPLTSGRRLQRGKPLRPEGESDRAAAFDHGIP